MNYWLVKSKFEMDRTELFIKNDFWQNFTEKHFNAVNSVQEGDILLLGDKSLIIYYAVCIENEKNGTYLVVDEWKRFQKPINFSSTKVLEKIIVKINDTDLIEKIKSNIEEQKAVDSIIIKSIELENFTLFKKNLLEFSSGINIFIGENGTGKTQLLKLLYSLIKGNNILPHNLFPLKFPIRFGKTELLFQKEIESILKPESIENLITKNRNKTLILLNLDKYKIEYCIHRDKTVNFKIEKDNNITIHEKKALFLPAKEILSFYTGFRSIYRQTSFDETFDDLATSLGKIVPKNRYYENFEEKMLKDLEEILGGKIVLDNDRFYLLEQDGTKREITLVAEGLRKLGTIFHLLANETIEKGSVIFWDEPEANLNPKVIKYVAKMMLELERAGVQIFIATHSLFLINEIEILRKKENKIQYFSFGFDNKKELRISQSSKLEELKDLILLDEELDQGDRFMSRER